MEAVELAALTRWFRVSGYYSLPKRPVGPDARHIEVDLKSLRNTLLAGYCSPDTC